MPGSDASTASSVMRASSRYWSTQPGLTWIRAGNMNGVELSKLAMGFQAVTKCSMDSGSKTPGGALPRGPHACAQAPFQRRRSGCERLLLQRQATTSHRVVNQVFGVAAACLLCFSNASVIADKVVFLSINRCRNRIEPVSNFAHRPAQKAGRGVLLTVHTVLHEITGRLKHLLVCCISKL